MTMLRAIWQDLIEKKLWLVAVPLVVMIFAVPFALGRTAEPDAPVPPAPPAIADSGPSLALTSSDTTGFARAPRVNKKALNPFGRRDGDAGLKKLAAKLGSAADAVAEKGAGGGGSTGGGGTPAPSDPNPPKPPSQPKEPKPEYENDDLLSFLYQEDAGEPMEMEDVRTLTPLPDADVPFLVYVGKTADGKASFLVSAEVKVSGQGACTPSKADCRTLEMAIGETTNFELLTKKNGEGTNVIAKLTVTDLVRGKVLVNGDAEESTSNDGAADSGGLDDAATRAIGARALKSVLDDEKVLASLQRQKIKIRR